VVSSSSVELSSSIGTSTALGASTSHLNVSTVEGRRVKADSTEKHGLVDVLGLGKVVEQAHGSVVVEVGHAAGCEREGEGAAGNEGWVLLDTTSETFGGTHADLVFLRRLLAMVY
jgi:hypothetical protein